MNVNQQQIGNVMSTLAPLASLIPGGQIAAPLLGGIGGLLSATSKTPPSTRLAGAYAFGGPVLPQMERSTTYVRPQYNPLLKPNINTGYNPGLNYPNNQADVVRMNLAPDFIDVARAGKPEYSNKKGTDFRFREKAYGGDLPLTDSSFMVKGNPNQKDSEYYPNQGVYLDDQEVVKMNAPQAFVFSNRLRNPETKQSFAKDAKTLELSTGRAERRMKHNADPISQATKQLNEMLSNSLASKQEAVAYAKGKRTADPSQIAMAFGGGLNISPDSSQVISSDTLNLLNMYGKDIGNSIQQGYVSPEGVRLNPFSGAYPKLGKGMAYGGPYDPPTKRPFYNANMEAVGDEIPFMQLPPAQAQNMGSFDPLQNLAGQSPYRNIPGIKVPSGSSRKPAYGGSRKEPKTEQTFPDPSANLKLPPMFNNTRDPRKNFINGEMDLSGTIPMLDPSYSYQGVGPSSGAAPTIPQVTSNTTPKLPKNTTVANTAVAGKSKSQPFTTGDYMQMAAAATSIARGFSRPEQEKANLDTTQLTRTTYDVAPQLYQNQRGYQNALNNTNANSPTLRRAIANQLYAGKLNQDSETVARYQDMNNQALTQYQERASNQSRFNAKQTDYTQDINARNRAAAMMNRDNSIQSFANVGMMLNERKQAQAYVNALKVRYPDIAESYINEIMGYGK